MTSDWIDSRLPARSTGRAPPRSDWFISQPMPIMPPKRRPPAGRLIVWTLAEPEADEWTEGLPLSSTLRRHPPILHKPACPESLLSSKVAHQLDQLHLSGSWFGLVPSRVGGSQALNLATEAFFMANIVAIDGGSPPTDACWLAYGRAVSSLRRAVSTREECLSDDTVLACALLAHAERGMGFVSDTKDSPMRYTLSHLYGLQMILTSRAKTRTPSEVSYTTASWQYTVSLDVPVALGTISPFEDFPWFESEPHNPEIWSTTLRRLKGLGLKIVVQLPRLIIYVRSWQRLHNEDDKARSSDALKMALDLAKRLYVLKDEDAENTLLHRIKVNKSTKPFIASCIPYSFTFATLADFETAICYWHSRVMILRICWRLAPTDERAALANEGSRMTRNIIMSWQAGLGLGLYGRIRLLFATIHLWGALKDFGTYPDPKVRSWLSERASRLYEAIFGKLSDHDLDEAAEVYVGGPLAGIFVRLYRKSWPQPPSTYQTVSSFEDV